MKNRRRLIVNADGFGFGAGATDGIIEAVSKSGFITSVSVLCNFDDISRLKDFVKRFPDHSVGVHVNPVAGKPLLPPDKVPTLVNDKGEFHNRSFRRMLSQGRINPRELEAELDAQVESARSLAGDSLTHIDSQANSHLEYFSIFLRVAKRHNIDKMRTNASIVCLEADNPRQERFKAYLKKPYRWLGHHYRAFQMQRAKRAGMKMADRLITVGYSSFGDKTDFNNWKRILRNLPAGVSEIYCHPAYADDTLRTWSYYVEEREKELKIFSDSDLADYAEELGIQLISFFNL